MKRSVVSVSSLMLVLLAIATADTLIPVGFGKELNRNDQVQSQDLSCLISSEISMRSHCDSGEEAFPLFISSTTTENSSLYVMVRLINESAHIASTRNSNSLFDPKTVELCIEYVALTEVSNNISPRVCGPFVDDGTILRMDLPTQSSSSKTPQTGGAHVLHAWAQAQSPISVSKDGILIRSKYGSSRSLEMHHLCSSDVYVTLDFSLSASGLVMHYGSVGLTVQENICVTVLDSVEVGASTRPDTRESPSSSSPSSPSLPSSSSYNTSIRGTLSHPYSLQRLAADFCASHRMTSASCGRLITKLSVSLHKRTLAEVLGLPSVQYMPSPQDPYLFLHIEKNAGTALR
jgi:hypothetical protein